jgi:hypothetical protein
MLFAIALLGGCGKKPTLEYVVPNGYTGILKLCGGVADGVTLTPTNGLIVLTFPSSETLNVKGPLPVFEWHKERARYADGTDIPIYGFDSNVSNNIISLRGLGVKNDNRECWYLVGKEGQMPAAMNQFYGFDVPKR